MEAKKIAVACFIGGSLCCVVALIFAPVYWWLGLIAGFAGGYLSYEFREVRKAVPIAFRAARKCGASVWDNAVVKIMKARAWLSKPHPFFYPAAVITVPFYIWGMYYFFQYTTGDIFKIGVLGEIFLSIVIFGGLIICFVGAICVVMAPLAILAFIGARAGERCYWWPLLISAWYTLEEDVKRLEKKGLERKPTTYLNVLRWTAKGFGLTVMFFIWTIWKYLVIGIWKTLCFSCRFSWHLFKLIHSKKRVLCAIDGTLGGTVSYIWLFSASMSFAEQAVLVIFGGFLGAAFGIANWEIVSKRILHLPISTKKT